MTGTDALTFAANHVWQSTIFAALAALIALALRRQRAQVRYWVWLAASLKFLLPFAVLTAIGGALSWRTVEVIPYENSVALIETVSQPFSQTQVTVRRTTSQPDGTPLLSIVRAMLLPVWGLGSAIFLVVWAGRWRRVNAMRRRATRIREGREVQMLQRLATVHGVRPLPIFETDTALEPGIFGVTRPILLWPRGISDHLSDDEVEAILAHELCHVRRQDNLAAALHMAVQTVFWFHPLVWWIGARLVDERERACDEEVLTSGSEPTVYAEGILKTCKFSLESPLACVSGVTGSDLKKRIEQIMAHDAAPALPFWRQALLTVAGVMAFATPVVLGALNPPPQSREVAAPATLPAFKEVSIRPNPSPGRGGRGGQMQPGRFVGQNLTLRTVIRRAYGPDATGPGDIPDLFESQVAGGPEWLGTDKFDIVAITPASTQPTSGAEMRLMLQRMLAERFNLAAHWEIRELPVYALVRVRPDGPLPTGMTIMSDEDCERAKPVQPGQPPAPGELPSCNALQFGPGRLISGGVPIQWFANSLTNVPAVTGIDRMVLDRTGLDGRYRFALQFAAAGAANANPDRPELFTALQEQLGLKLEPIRAPIDVLVIDRLERPAEN